MLFLTDTCFWSHVKELYDDETIDLRPTLNLFRWGITEAVKSEINRRQLGHFIPFDKATLITLSEEELNVTRKQVQTLSEFDLADQTLIVAGLRDKSVVLTDDGELYMECIVLNIDTMLLPQFCLSLVKNGAMDKTIIFKALRFWESTGKYSKKFIKKWKETLREIRGMKPSS